mmetsp:Transcript_37842/g.88561  ORF Transcript_37842/g.88561 Transcript_37842/m.88561 type:complete len:95 (+) Transcript_37842:603-887(+)
MHRPSSALDRMRGSYEVGARPLAVGSSGEDERPVAVKSQRAAGSRLAQHLAQRVLNGPPLIRMSSPGAAQVSERLRTGARHHASRRHTCQAAPA